MHTDTTVTEVFEEIEPDPDEILEAWDADSPEAVLGGTGEHDPDSDDTVDADDVTAAEVFADLKTVSLEVADADATTAETSDEKTANGNANATDGRRERTERTSAGSEEGWELVGPDPTATRIANDAFGTVSLEPDGDVTGEFTWIEA